MSKKDLIDKNTVTMIVIHKDDLAHKDRISDVILLCEQLVDVGGEPRHSLTFDGFLSDPREVWEIPECIEVCRRIMVEVPKVIKYVDQSTLAAVLYATAIKNVITGRWDVNPAWAVALPNYKDIKLQRKP